MNKISEQRGAFAGLTRAEEAQGWKWEAPEMEYQGKKITLPSDPARMPIPNAIEHLQRLQKAKETKSNPTEFIKCFPFDGLVAFQRALEHLFGWASAEMVPTMFGPQPPQPLSVQTGPGHDDFVVVPRGEFSIPALPNSDRVGIQFTRTDAGEFGITIYAKTTREFENVVRAIAKTTREFLEAESIYKGKALRLFDDGNVGLDLDRQPEFINTQKIRAQDLHLNPDVMRMVETSIFTPMRFSDLCRRHNVPLKRGVLLEGPYGVGKSLISTITSQVAVDCGWTFITIENPHALRDTLHLARQYQPCIVFCEDIDRAVSLDRDDEANEILNVVDGILSKTAEVMVVFTTNHVDQISKAMLRPGRLDAVISVPPPDKETIMKLMRHYGGGIVDPNADLNRPAEVLEGQIPATIREVVERSKLHTIPRLDAEEAVYVTADDLVATALSMTRHLELLNAPDEEEEPAEVVLRKLGEYLGLAGDDAVDAIKSVGGMLANQNGQNRNLINDARNGVGKVADGVGKVKEDTETILKKITR